MHNEQLKAGSALEMLGATGEFIKMLPLATEVWVCVRAYGLWVKKKNMQRLKHRW